MMKKIILVALSGLFITGLAHAECPASLDKHEMMKCQKVEKSGGNYQEWLRSEDGMAEKSRTSPITGEDVTKIAPAAGSSESEAVPAE